MADAVNTQIILNGQRNIVLLLTNISDGTGEALVKKFDAQSATFGVTVQGQAFLPGVHAKIERIEYDIRAGGCNLYWEASANVPLLVLSGAGTIGLDEPYQLINPNTAGATGSILLSTSNFTNASGYTITLHLTKNVPRS